MKILLNTIAKVKNFIQDVDVFEEDIDIRMGRFCIDGHSIMGIFSLDLSGPLETSIITNNEDTIARFNEIVKKYEMEETNE